jgi:hypothetical protein
MMSKHIPGPWEAKFVDDGVINHWVVRSSRDEWICDCGIGDNAEGLARANARFIVIACNAHEEMLAALRVITVAFDMTLLSIGENARMSAAPILKLARSAIAKADGGEV